MVRMVITGMRKEEMEHLVHSIAGSQIETKVCSDLEGVMAVKSGKADYYLGACQSGAGGALAVATGLLGAKSVVRLSGTGSTPRIEEIEQAVTDGKKAFGMASNHIQAVIPPLVKAILANLNT